MKTSSKVVSGIGAAMLLGAAGQASANLDVSFYGLVDVFAGSVETPYSADSMDVVNAGGMSTSFLGSSMSYTMPSGLKAIAAVEMFFRPDTAEQGRYANDEFFARSAYVGLQGDFGMVRAGRNTSPYFLPTVFTNSLGDSFVFSPAILHTFQGGNGGTIVGDSGWSNSISYTTPSFNGLTANVVYAAGERMGESSEGKFGANVIYRKGALLAVAAFHDVDIGDPASPIGGAGEVPFTGLPGASEQTAYMLGLAYDFGVVRLFGQFHSQETDTFAGDSIDTDIYNVGVTAPVGPGTVMASYGVADFSGDLDRERKTWSLGYSYQLTQNVNLYGIFVDDDIDDIDDGSSFGVGARLRF